MTWDYYNDKEIKKSETYSMVMSVSVEIQRENDFLEPHEVGLNERMLHSKVEDVLKQLQGESYSEKFEEDGEEYTLIVNIDRVDENR